MISQETVEVLERLKTTLLAIAQVPGTDPGQADGLKLAAALVQDEITALL
jgi:hypothetical protein